MSERDQNEKLALIDAALTCARERGDVPEADIALLFAARAEATGVPFKPEHLTLLMGVTEERAEDLFAVLAERGFIQRELPLPLEQALADGLVEPKGWTPDGEQIYGFSDPDDPEETP